MQWTTIGVYPHKDVRNGGAVFLVVWSFASIENGIFFIVLMKVYQSQPADVREP